MSKILEEVWNVAEELSYYRLRETHELITKEKNEALINLEKSRKDVMRLSEKIELIHEKRRQLVEERNRTLGREKAVTEEIFRLREQLKKMKTLKP